MSDEPGRLPAGLALSWGVQPVQRRGPKPALSVRQIVATGIEFGDTQGFEAISLQKIAAHLGVSTNAMYRYVSSKDELIVLVTETAWGRAPRLTAEGWREGAQAWVHAQLERYSERPWLLDVPIRGAPVTPNLLSWVEVLLQMLDDTGLSQHDNLGCVLLLDGYVRSYANLARQLEASDAAPVQSEEVGAFLVPRLAAGDYPMLTVLYTNQEYEDGLDDDLEFGLDRILDGIQVLIDRKL
ncbi:TetR family transcriptional regulator [Kribbella orskensis]|uniref:TetR family transcriptional regulator n=1 Tax=Kribbella orskensis TaxID=2512216 RepID=A0ABY2B7X8_9ACTN|nr:MULTISPECIES: TetR/AcrR family transcriptional regulator [Kribbella]TCN30485.1 TetR family transcriptional regulator [Kribbella sp. VKM Ac-2500]TCO11127.1 TetR family transcriptional regulator [Kribbella orskensis]